LPLRIGLASAKLYIERGADWCGQGKNNSFFEGCGMSTCQYGTLFLPDFKGVEHVVLDVKNNYPADMDNAHQAQFSIFLDFSDKNR